MRPRRPRSTLFPYTTLFRSAQTRFSIVIASVIAGSATAKLGRTSVTSVSHVITPSSTICAISRVVMVLVVERSEEHTSELQSRPHLVCRLLLEKKKEQPRY